MASLAVASLLEYLEELALQYPDQIQNAEGLHLLVEEFKLLKSILEDVSRNRKSDPILDNLEVQLKEVVHELEDTIDSRILTLSARSKIMNFARKSLLPNSSLFGVDLNSFRKDKLGPIYDRFQGALQSVPLADESETSKGAFARQRLVPRDSNVVGLEDELRLLASEVIRETENLEVVSITGMPGIGKTTMAWRIFRDPRISYEYPTCIWVHVSQEFDMQAVLLTILKKFTNESMYRSEESDLRPIVSEYLRMGKFMIVLDDVWTTEAWNQIKQVLPMENGRSKVLLTSQSDEVGLCASRKQPHKLRGLNPNESWELMQLEVFGETDAYPRELEKVGKEIADSCSGLPVGIIVAGGILSRETPFRVGNVHHVEKQWRSIQKTMNDTLAYGMHPVISLSYVTLPPDLKLCFLYLGMFPKDTEFPIWKLTWLWIGEGFVTKKQGRSLEEIAKEYLKELIDRNLLVKGRISISGEVITCRIHNMVRDFCQNEAATGKQNLYKEIRSDHKTFEPSITSLDNFRRLCIHTNVRDFFIQKPKAPNARSFLCLSSIPIIFENSEISCFSEAFGLVRVLDATPIKFPKFPPSLTQLVHLRYLTLSGDVEFKTIPKAISKLWRLETLVVSTPSRKLEVEANIWTMMHLSHLKTKASLILQKGKGKGGNELHTLTRISPQDLTEDVLDKARNLKKLGVQGMLFDAMSLEKLVSLEKLTLVHDVFPGHASERPLPCLPVRTTFPPTLRILVLVSTYLSWELMAKIGQIDTLEVLKLKENAFIGESWEVAHEGFNHLEALSIDHSELRYWTASPSSFPELRRLELKHCKNLQEVPGELGGKLEMLHMESVTRYAISSAKEIEEGRGKLGGGEFKLVIAPGDLIAY